MYFHTPTNQHKLTYFSTTCNDSLSVHAKISIFSLKNNTFSKPFELILIIVEYFQLISQTILLRLAPINNLLSRKTPQLAFVYFAQFISPVSLFPFQQDTRSTLDILTLLIIFAISRHVLYWYVILAGLGKYVPNPILIRLWRFIFRIQSRIILYITTSFCTSAIRAAVQNQFTFFGIGKTGTIILFSVFFAIEIVYTILLTTRHHSILPTKSLLSSKNSLVELLTLSQKLILQIIELTLASLSFTSPWIYIIVNLVFTVLRTGYYFKTIPLYSIKGFIYQGLILMVVASLDIASFVQIIAEYQDKSRQGDYSLIWMAWFVLAALMMKISYEYSHRAIIDLVMKPSRGSPTLHIHKISLIKYFIKQRRGLAEHNTKNEMAELINKTLRPNLNSILILALKNANKDRSKLSCKKFLNETFLSYLEATEKRYPKDDMLKLYIAELYAKKLKLYGTAMKFLLQLRKSSKSIIAVSASISIWEIQSLLRKESTNNNSELDLYVYFMTHVNFADLKTKMLKQNEHQLSIYNEMTKNSPDLAKIHDTAQLASSCRGDINRAANILIEQVPDYYTEPVLLTAHYHFTLNYSLIHFLKYFKIFSQKQKKYQKVFQKEKLKPQNAFQGNTAFVIVSGQKEDLGKIHFCSNSLAKIYGGEPELYEGADISSLAPIISQSFSLLFSRNNNQKIDQAYLGKTFRDYSYNKNGYLIEVEYYIDVFPFLMKGFFFSVFVKSINITKDYMIIDDNGNIEGITREVGQRLGFDKALTEAGVPVSQISKELHEVVEAFKCESRNKDKEKTENRTQIPLNKKNRGISYKDRNFVFASSEQIKLNTERARELYSVYSDQGGEIELTHVSQVNQEDTKRRKEQTQKSFYYSCKVKVLSEQPELLRLVTLEKCKRSAQLEVDVKTALRDKKVIMSQSEDSMSDIDEISGLDEKQKGWINFGALEPKQGANIVTPTSFREEKMNRDNDKAEVTDGNLLSPLSSVRLLKASSFLNQKSISYVQNSTESNRRNSVKINNIPNFQEPEESKTSQKSKITLQEQISQAFNLAFLAKHYSRRFRVFYILFYLLILGILVIQINVKLLTDTSIKNLKAKKEILYNAQQRDTLLVSLHRTYRYVWDVGSGYIVPSQFSTFSYYPSATLNLVNTTLKNLSTVNHDALIYAGSIEESLKKVLFTKDVRVFYSDPIIGQQNYINMTSFQAADQVIDAGMKGVVIAKTSVVQAKTQIFFDFKNALNDLLLKTEATSALLMDSIATETVKSRNSILITLIVIIIISVLILLIFIRFVLRAYIKEKNYLHALIKLDQYRINELKNRLHNFQKLVISGNFVEENIVMQSFQRQMILNFDKRYEAKKQTHSPIHKATLKKYMMYIGKAVLFQTILISLATTNSLEDSAAIEDLHLEQAKLYFVNGIGKTINMGYLCFHELFANNDTTTIRNQNISVMLQQTINELDVIKTKVLDAFENDDSSYDYMIGKMLFGHTCAFLNQTGNYANYCPYLVSKARTIAFVPLMSDYVELIKDKLERFRSSNKTRDSLRAVQIANYDLMLSYIRVTIDEIGVVTDRINAIFEAKFEDVTVKSQIILIVILTCILLLTFLAWPLMFKNVREGTNQFKNTLQNFPPSLILSNFLLKTYFIKVSNGQMDSIKREI